MPPLSNIRDKISSKHAFRFNTLDGELREGMEAQKKSKIEITVKETITICNIKKSLPSASSPEKSRISIENLNKKKSDS